MRINPSHLVGLQLSAITLIVVAVVALTTMATRTPKYERPPAYTKESFRELVEGKTKAEIRARFGSPDVVWDATDTWSYLTLPVYDAEAGIKVQPSIRFEGFGSSDEVALGVSY